MYGTTSDPPGSIPRTAAALGASELRRTIETLGALAELHELDDYPQVTARLLRQLIPCDIASCTLVAPGQMATVAGDPIGPLSPDDGDIFAAYAHQHPLIAHFAQTGDQGAYRISDFITQRQLHATELYDYIYRPISTEYQLAITIGPPPRAGAMIGLTVNRATRDFTVSERALLELVAPHFRATLQRLSDRALIEAALAAAARDDDDPTTFTAAGAFAALGGRGQAERVDPAMLRVLGLTRRQAEILALASRGETTAAIAGELGISPRTVEKHFEAIYERLNVANRPQAIVRALELTMVA